jgi:hypothetical protein
MEDKSDELTQTELDVLTTSFLDWSTPLVTFDQQLEWADSQDVQILQIDRNPNLNDYIVTIHRKDSNPPRMHVYP